MSYSAPAKPPFTAKSCRIQYRTAGIICRRNLKNLPWTVHGASDLTPACGYAGRLGSIGYTTNPSDECTECRRDDVFASLLSHGKYVEEVDELFPTSTTFGLLASQFYAKPARRSDQRPRQLHVNLPALILSDQWSIQHEITLERRYCSLSTRFFLLWLTQEVRHTSFDQWFGPYRRWCFPPIVCFQQPAAALKCRYP